ncbi:MAG: UDP-3-O-(3-hydroxymyristoyl)glucosamine N-acyltransferase [Verrucomicrobiota bacterium]
MKQDSSLSLEEIASMVGGTLKGDASLIISGINDLENAEETDLSFLGHSKYHKQAESTKAGAILIAPEEKLKLPCSWIEVKNPSAAFAKVVEHFIPNQAKWPPGVHTTACIDPEASVDPSAYVGPNAVIEANAKIGAETYIGANCYVGEDTVIGEQCHFYPQVTVRNRCKIANRVILHPGVVIGSDGFGYEFSGDHHKKIPQVGYVQLDDDVEIGANSTIDRGRFGRTWIKTGSKLDNLVMVAHNVSIGPHAIIVAQCGISGSSHLGAYVTVAGQSAVVGHVNITDQVTITAWTAVTKDIKEKGVYRGGPAKPIKESMRIEALTMRLPELYKKIRTLEEEVSQLREKS